jgi:DNA-binding protein HU-beta
MPEIEEPKTDKKDQISYPDFIALIAQNAGVSKEQAKITVNAMKLTIAKLLQEGKTINLPEFGKFQVVERKERKGRNPKTGAEMSIPEHKVVKFKASSVVKDALKAVV